MFDRNEACCYVGKNNFKTCAGQNTVHDRMEGGSCSKSCTQTNARSPQSKNAVQALSSY